LLKIKHFYTFFMAKTETKKTSTTAKAPAKKSTAKAKAPAADVIEKACEQTLSTLRTLGLDTQLQNDLEWCLGSYRSDKNPVGLYAMAERAVALFEQEKAKKTKGITAKLITDLQKAIASREA